MEDGFCPSSVKSQKSSTLSSGGLLQLSRQSVLWLTTSNSWCSSLKEGVSLSAAEVSANSEKEANCSSSGLSFSANEADPDNSALILLPSPSWSCNVLWASLSSGKASNSLSESTVISSSPGPSLKFANSSGPLSVGRPLLLFTESVFWFTTSDSCWSPIEEDVSLLAAGVSENEAKWSPDEQSIPTFSSVNCTNSSGLSSTFWASLSWSPTSALSVSSTNVSLFSSKLSHENTDFSPWAAWSGDGVSMLKLGANSFSPQTSSAEFVGVVVAAFLVKLDFAIGSFRISPTKLSVVITKLSVAFSSMQAKESALWLLPRVFKDTVSSDSMSTSLFESEPTASSSSTCLKFIWFEKSVNWSSKFPTSVALFSPSPMWKIDWFVNRSLPWGKGAS